MKGEEVKMERFSSFYGNDTANEASSNQHLLSATVKLESHTFEQLQQRTLSQVETLRQQRNEKAQSPY